MEHGQEPWCPIGSALAISPCAVDLPSGDSGRIPGRWNHAADLDEARRPAWRLDSYSGWLLRPGSSRSIFSAGRGILCHRAGAAIAPLDRPAEPSSRLTEMPRHFSIYWLPGPCKSRAPISRRMLGQLEFSPPICPADRNAYLTKIICLSGLGRLARRLRHKLLWLGARHCSGIRSLAVFTSFYYLILGADVLRGGLGRV